MQEPPKKRKKWPWVVGSLAVLTVLGCVGVFALFAGGAKVVADAAGEMDANQQGKNAAVGAMNKPATDGKFEFTVTRMACGVDHVGSETFGTKAQGEFCLIITKVKNVGKSVESFDDSSQKAYTADGVEYSADGAAGMDANDDGQTFLEDINPGNQVTATLVFDVPKHTKLASVVLHESSYTAGVKVPLK
ncbi:DUF4352 domain-containing protein [Actinoplanes sp. N902-109]|uniref:DUF4352 domain-containing protein n=1 Tax=Actinoplanes sp. (strain N902-109) TaxID=649831 RepID=UPI0003295F9F|nr:DUF4352 domain-containing protein [Actinoplanes sp. N902-109]AGL13670.1 hypothetical protein L083_0160 [Actinoplanes sp. N902-109]